MSTKFHVTAAALAVVVTALPTTGLSAQSGWTQRDTRASVEVELFRPHFAEEIDFRFATSAGFVSVRLPLSPSWGLSADLPFARAGWDAEGGPSSSSLVGNPYLGLEWARSSRLTAELGMRVPVGEIDEIEDLAPVLVGTAGEVERMEAFVPRTLGVYATADYRIPLDHGLSVRLRGGPSFVGGDGGSDDLFLGYGGSLWYGRGATHVGAGLIGRANLTTDDREAERTVHQAVASVNHRVRGVRPGLSLRMPLDDAVREISSYTVAVSLSWTPVR